MSAASRAREAAQAKALAEAKYADLPPVGKTDRDMLDPDDIAGHVQIWEFERLVGWFVTQRREIAEMMDVEKVVVDAEEGILVVPKPKVSNVVPFFGTFRHEAPWRAVEG